MPLAMRRFGPTDAWTSAAGNPANRVISKVRRFANLR